MAAEWLEAGRVGRPHGLDGSFHVTGARAALLVRGTAVAVAGTHREIVRRAGTDEHPVLRLEGCEDRDAAQALRGETLLVARRQAPPLEEGEWWPEELEGCRVHDSGQELGVVRGVLALPSCEALEVEGEGGETLLVPLVRDAVREVDVEARSIDVRTEFLAG